MLSTAHSVFPWSVSVRWADLWPHSQCPDHNQTAEESYLGLIGTNYLFQATANLSRDKLEEYQDIFSFFDRCLHLHISINWLEYRNRRADIKIESDSVQLKGWKWEHLLLRAGTSDENLRLVSIRNGTSGPLLSNISRYTIFPSGVL